MTERDSMPATAYFLGFDGGGTKTECVIADGDGRILGRATAGPSNPLRTGYSRAWFSLSDAADILLARQKITSNDIRGVCAGVGGAGRASVVHRLTSFLQRSFPRAEVEVTTDLEIAFEAAFESRHGIILIAGTGSGALGRDSTGRRERVGGKGPWFSDEGSAFDIGREAVRAVALADEQRGPETALTKKIISPHHWRDWTILLEAVSKNADDVFPKIFPFVAQLADKGDAVSQRILTSAAASLAGLAQAVAKELGWTDRTFDIAKSGGVYGHSKFFDAAIEAETIKLIPRARLIGVDVSPAEAAVRMAVRQVRAKGNAA